MTYLIIIAVSILIGITIAKLYPYFKDGKVTPEEKAQVQEILFDVAKEILAVSTNKTKEQLITSITSIVLGRMAAANIKGFKEEDIKLMVEVIVDKLEGVLPEK